MLSQETAAASSASGGKSTGELKLPPPGAHRAEFERVAPMPPFARRDFTVRLAELTIQLVAIVGAVALGLGITAYFSEHRYVVAYLVAYAVFSFADLLVRDPATLGVDPVRFARRVTYELPLLALFLGAPFERTFIYGGEAPRWLGALGLLIELAGIWLTLGARNSGWLFLSQRGNRHRQTAHPKWPVSLYPVSDLCRRAAGRIRMAFRVWGADYLIAGDRNRLRGYQQ
jgi:hypothetical protein